MTVAVNPRDLATAVATAHRANDTRPATPDYAQITLTWNNNTMEIWATGERATNGRTIPAEHDTTGTLAVSGSLLDRICRTLGDGPVTLTHDDAQLIITQRKSRWELPRYTEPISGPTGPTDNGGTVAVTWLTDALGKAQKVADDGGGKSGVILFDHDGHPAVLGMSHFAAEVHHSTFGSITGTCDVSSRLLLPYTDQEVTIRWDDNLVTVHDDEVWTIGTRNRIAASIPVTTVMQYLSTPLGHKLSVDPDELLAAVDQVAAVIDKTTSGLVPVTIDYEPGRATVRAESAEAGIAAKTDDTGRATCNATYLRRLVQHSGSGDLEINPERTAFRVSTSVYTGMFAGIDA